MAGLLTAVIGLLGLINYRTQHDYFTTVGESFASTLDALTDEKLPNQIAAAVLHRRFLNARSIERPGRAARVFTHWCRLRLALMRTCRLVRRWQRARPLRPTSPPLWRQIWRGG